MEWAEFANLEPDLADEGEKRFDATGLALVGSLRKDGTPRISPTEPLIHNGRLYLGMMWHSTKALDLLRDPRVLVHNTVTDRLGADGEFKVRGRVLVLEDRAEREGYAEALKAKIDWAPTGDEWHLFAVDIEHVTLQWFEKDERHTRVWAAPNP
jgi:hypothetical protein